MELSKRNWDNESEPNDKRYTECTEPCHQEDERIQELLDLMALTLNAPLKAGEVRVLQARSAEYLVSDAFR
jgi:hypothetical protein